MDSSNVFLTKQLIESWKCTTGSPFMTLAQCSVSIGQSMVKANAHRRKVNFNPLLYFSITSLLDYSLFVGDLAGEVTETLLLDHFRTYFPAATNARVSSCGGAF